MRKRDKQREKKVVMAMLDDGTKERVEKRVTKMRRRRPAKNNA